MTTRPLSNRLTRRRLVAGAGGAGLVLVAAPGLIRRAASRSLPAGGGGDPFSLGVASGAPRPDGFVLWTRLAPEPLSSNPETPGGMSGGDVAVAHGHKRKFSAPSRRSAAAPRRRLWRRRLQR